MEPTFPAPNAFTVAPTGAPDSDSSTETPPGGPPRRAMTALLGVALAAAFIAVLAGCGAKANDVRSGAAPTTSAPVTSAPQSVASTSAPPPSSTTPDTTVRSGADATKGPSTTAAPIPPTGAGATQSTESTDDIEKDLNRVQNELDQAKSDLSSGPTEATADPRG